jgi:autotransporter-associated beta strand protein
LTVAQSTTTAFGGQIVNGPTNLLALSLTGPGTLILSPGAPGNSYTGGTTVDSGTLVLESPTSLAGGSSSTVGQGASALFAPAAGPADHEYMVPAAPVGAAAVPEPGTLVLLAFGLGVGAACRRFSRRSTVASSSTRV